MTRINVIPPADLTDAHLIAEYRELPRIFALARSLTPREIVPRYTLGAGHVRFFYPRTGYLSRRQSAIIAECISRGFNVAHLTPPTPIAGLDDDWTPDDDARAVNLARLREKLTIARRPYTHRGVRVGVDFYGA